MGLPPIEDRIVMGGCVKDIPEDKLKEMEAKAAELAGRVGLMLMESFGRPLEIEYKDEKKHDPVTAADKKSQAYLIEELSRQFPEHSIVGEEGEDGEDGVTVASDFVWVLDPLDGTTNFLNGLPIYAASIGLLHRSVPIVGALFIPWPGSEPGTVLHARRGGGAWVGDSPLSIPTPAEPDGSRIAGLPASFGAQFRLDKATRRQVGDPRITGSIAYELALAARGVLRYVLFGNPRLWDVAAGALIVEEAGGTVLVGQRRSRVWEPIKHLGPSWEDGPPSLKQVRGWTGPVIAGNSEVVPLVAAGLKRRRSLIGRVRRAFRRRKGGR